MRHASCSTLPVRDGCVVSPDTPWIQKIKKPIIRGVQFPRAKDMEIFKVFFCPWVVTISAIALEASYNCTHSPVVAAQRQIQIRRQSLRRFGHRTTVLRIHIHARCHDTWFWRPEGAVGVEHLDVTLAHATTRRRTLKRVLTSETLAEEKSGSASGERSAWCGNRIDRHSLMQCLMAVRVSGKSLRRTINNPARDVVLFLYVCGQGG